MWEVIAAKLGWNTFPGNGNEIGRSSPSIANQISNVYNEYLAGVEAAYIQVYLRSRRNAMSQQQQVIFMDISEFNAYER